MRKVLFLFFLILTTSVVANAQLDRHANQKGNGHSSSGKGNRYGHYTSGNAATKTVNAPLDGGLLLILGGAGAAYYAARKRRKES